jgi:hypothetical protein
MTRTKGVITQKKFCFLNSASNEKRKKEVGYGLIYLNLLLYRCPPSITAFFSFCMDLQPFKNVCAKIEGVTFTEGQFAGDLNCNINIDL